MSGLGFRQFSARGFGAQVAPCAVDEAVMT